MAVKRKQRKKPNVKARVRRSTRTDGHSHTVSSGAKFSSVVDGHKHKVSGNRLLTTDGHIHRLI